MERLSRNLIPTLYELKLKIFLPYHSNLSFDEKNFTVEGYVKLNFKCLNQTSILKLHAKKLKIDYEKICLKQDLKLLQLKSLVLNNNTNLLELKPKTEFVKGFNYTIEIFYKAFINNKSVDGGLFRTFYLSRKNETR